MRKQHIYKVVAPYNNSFKAIIFRTMKKAKEYVKENSIHLTPFDSRFLTIETRVKLISTVD